MPIFTSSFTCVRAPPIEVGLSSLSACCSSAWLDPRSEMLSASDLSPDDREPEKKSLIAEKK